MDEEVVSIPLTQGKFAIVDAKNAEYLMQFKWFAVKSGNTFYAYRRDGTHAHRSMHREIMNQSSNDHSKSGLEVDHINRNGLDNRESNMRLVTHQIQSLNRDQKIGATGYRGVTKTPRASTYIAQIKIDGKKYRIGAFKTAEEAARAFDDVAYDQHGDNAKLNFPRPSNE